MAQDKVKVMSQDTKKEVKCYIKPPKPPQWLVMIYLAGDNGLSANCIDILQELEEAFDCYPQYADDVRVLACFDSNTPRPRGARYFEIHFRRKYAPNSHLKWELHNDLVPIECLPGNPVEIPDFCIEDSTSKPPASEPVPREGLSRFIHFALSHHKHAKKHMLILFGHGSAVAGNTFLADNTPPSFLRLKELREVLARHFDARQRPWKEGDEDTADDLLTEEEKKGRPPLDILACDNCMMNGIESAYELRRRVKYMIGSQGLVLALGWPFRKVLEEVLKNRNAHPKVVAERILRVCARNLLDFSLMDRSSEQSLCDLTTLREEPNLTTAVRELSRVLQYTLAPDYKTMKVDPIIRDMVRVARLEAQSYWSETFVDLYDFCLLLLERCNDFKTMEVNLPRRLSTSETPRKAKRSRADKEAPDSVVGLDIIDRFEVIANACNEVLEALKSGRKFVLCSYYIGPDSQYSNGVSIYFPWTLPEDPIIFEQEDDTGSGGGYGLSWRAVERARGRIERRVQDELRNPSRRSDPPSDYNLITAFDEYKTYEFAMPTGGDWAAFLTIFFKATLRNVRRFDVKYNKTDRKDVFLEEERLRERPFFNPSPVDLQKSSSDVDSETDCSCPTIKNYPRRFYLSPEDCNDVCPDDPHGSGGSTDADGKEPRTPCVSYLGWNVRGIVAEVITEGEGKKSRRGPLRY